jgi:hypothetical protein
VLVAITASMTPAAARQGRRGTLAIQLRVARGGPHGRKLGPVRLRLLLIVKTMEGFTIAKTKQYALSGHRFSYVLPPGLYRVSATSLPPVVNPTGRPCKPASSVVRVRVGHRVSTSVLCILVG